MMIAQDESMSKLTSKKMIFNHLEFKIPCELIQGNLDVVKKAENATCGGYVSGMFGFFFTEGLFTTLDLCQSRFPMQVQS